MGYGAGSAGGSLSRGKGPALSSKLFVRDVIDPHHEWTQTLLKGENEGIGLGKLH
jgi:hypothetical protein